MASPVFERMFEADFKEKGATVIPLPGKTYEEVDIFLRLLHPMHCWKPVEDDNIGVVLRMADEYEVKPLQQRCQYQMNTNLVTDKYMNFEKALFYLRLSDTHNIQETRSKAIESLAMRDGCTLGEN
ncbi:hypothetical protein V1264_001800 [Littorina saxatilis]|uniref:BTB domain-containing protein n=1 Tax=Littorina saxatilis TaxID=31220 RepID=A0AAN9C281_9CAEN